MPPRFRLLVVLCALFALAGASGAHAGTYTNPLPVSIPGGGAVESCANPSVIRGQASDDPYWYAYCSTDPLNGADQDGSGNFTFHLLPMLRSADLVHWTYVGDAFASRPSWVDGGAGLWSPQVEYFDGTYHLYYTASGTSLPGGGSAIGVATSTSPTGPWTDSGAPVVEPHAPSCCPNDRRWVFDPDVVESGGQRYIFYGSFFGGISARTLSADGLHSDPASQTQITIANRYEAAHVVRHGGSWYLLASAGNCCNGPLTGYSTFVGRADDVLGPYVDRQGVPLLAGRVGGTPALSLNGNRWVGAGAPAVLTDFDGQDWALYHAVDRDAPYFAGAPGFTRRPLLLDALDWVDGWPTVRGGRWASAEPTQEPAAQPGERTQYRPKAPTRDRPNAAGAGSDEFDGTTLGSQWTWVRPPDPSTFGVGGGALRFDTQSADLYVDANNASVLTEPAPDGDYVVDAKVGLNLPAEGCCFNYVQAGLVIYGDDDNYVKLSSNAIWETRQTEFAKETAPVPAGYPRYGSAAVGPPADATYLRIVRRSAADGGDDRYTAYTGRDGADWVRGATWTADLGASPRIGLVAMGGSGFTATFDYVRVATLK